LTVGVSTQLTSIESDVTIGSCTDQLQVVRGEAKARSAYGGTIELSDRNKDLQIGSKQI